MEEDIEALVKITRAWSGLAVLYRLFIVVYVLYETCGSITKGVISGIVLLLILFIPGLYLGFILAIIMP